MAHQSKKFANAYCAEIAARAFRADKAARDARTAADAYIETYRDSDNSVVRGADYYATAAPLARVAATSTRAYRVARYDLDDVCNGSFYVIDDALNRIAEYYDEKARIFSVAEATARVAESKGENGTNAAFNVLMDSVTFCDFDILS